MKKVWLPYPLWDIQGIELWLDEMAAKGYELKKWPGFSFIGRVVFQPSEEAKHCRYRLDPIGKGVKELRDRAANYRELGWRFVEQIGNLYAVYRCDDPDAPDLYTDSESLGWAMKRLVRRQWIALALCLFWAFWLFRDEAVLLFTAPQILPMRMILAFDCLAPAYILMVFLVGGQLISTLFQTVSLSHIRKKLLRGEDLPLRRPTYPELRHILSLSVSLALLLLLIVLSVRTDQNTQRLSTAPEEWTFPHVLLSEMLPTGTKLREYSDQELLHHDTFSHSWLAPEQYDTVQGGLARLPDGTSRQVRLSLDYVRTHSPELAGWVFSGKAAQWRQSMEEYWKNWEENASYIHQFQSAFDVFAEEELSHPGLDRLTRFSFQYPYEDWPRACYIGQLGNQVFVLELRGPDLETPLNLLAERMAAQNEPD